MRVRSIVLVASSALLLGACASFQGLDTRAAPIDSKQLNTADTLSSIRADAAWPALDWWTRFGDPQLDTLVQAALDGSPDLKLARARLDRAIALAGLADAARGPSLDANARDSYQRLSENSVAGSYRNLAHLSLDFNQDLDLWGRNAANLRAALGRVRAGEAESQQARLVLSTAVVGSYFELARTYDQRDIAEALLHQREQLLSLTRQRVGAGLDSNVALRQAEAAIPEAQAQVAALDEQMQLLHNQIAALLGAGPDRAAGLKRPAVTVDAALALPSALPADLIGRRPDVVAERWRVEAAAHDIAAAKAGFYPNINLTAFVGLDAIGLDKLFQGDSRVLGVGPALSLPLFDSGRLRNQLAARNADYDAAAEAYNATVIEAVHDVADQVARWRGVETRLMHSHKALERFEEAYRLAILRFKEGLTNYLTVLTVEGQVLAQRRQVADLEAERRANAVGLVRALGGGFTATPPNTTDTVPAA